MLACDRELNESATLVFGLDTFRQKHNDLLKDLFSKDTSYTDLLGLLLIDESWDEALKKARLTAEWITRAKNLLYIIGDINACQRVSPDAPLYELANYAEKLQKRKRHPLNFAENALARVLDELKLSYIPQYEIGGYRLDFLVNAASGQAYDVEVDGDIHLTAEAVEHDARRDAYVRNQGLKVLRCTARDIVHRPQVIKELLVRI